MSGIPRLGVERRLESFEKRRYYHVEKEPHLHRFAGELFGLGLKDRARKQEKSARSRLQASRPVGLGFGERDSYGPDENWDTRDTIEYRPAPSYYSNQQNY